MTETITRNTRKRRGSYAKTERTQTAILDAALDVFAESGYRAGSIREIAQRVGMSEAGLLHHFPSKSALLEAVLERRDHRSTQFLPTDDSSGADTLRGLVDVTRHNSSVPRIVELYCVLSAEATSPDHPAHSYFKSRYESTREIVTGAFHVLRQEGKLRSAMTPEGAAIATVAMMDGLQVQWLLDRSALDMAGQLSLFFDGLVDDAPSPVAAESAEESTAVIDRTPS